MIKCTTIFEVHFKHVCSCVLNESRVCGGIAPLILHLTAMQKASDQQHNPDAILQLKASPGTNEEGAYWAPGTLWTFNPHPANVENMVSSS
jgi:hypothetical protein